MTKIVRSIGSVKSILCSNLLAELLAAGVKDQGTDGWDFADVGPSLWRGLSISKLSISRAQWTHIDLLFKIAHAIKARQTESHRTSYACAVPCARVEVSVGACSVSRTL